MSGSSGTDGRSSAAIASRAAVNKFVAGALDLELGTDSLTGNRYLFAAANPVAYFEDGHWPRIKVHNPIKSAARAVKDIAKKALPLLSFVPVVGTAIDVVSAATGRDWLNGGKKLTGAERALMLAGAAAGMIPGAGIAAKASLKVAAKAATKSRTIAKVASTVARSGDEAAGMACAVNSFTPGTRVLMADGANKAIEDVELGDHVLATDPETGETAGKPVARLIEGRGLKHLVDLTINGHVVTATGGHPFWVHGRGWIDAEAIIPGDLVLEADGDVEPVTRVLRYQVAHRTVHNLTIADIHTYHVLAGEPILVHNCGKVHGNSLKSLRETHVYKIKNLADGTVYKVGESSQGLTRSGLSRRAETQVRRLMRHDPNLNLASEIIATFPNKAAARSYETRLLKRYHQIFGHRPPGNKTYR